MTTTQKTPALMILGTASHVGKSLLVTALCRIFSDEGFCVAPFKAQNMALNSAATPDGLEIGRAQALQAEAARITASADMNPILIKPSSDIGAQVVVRGRVWGQVTAADYHLRRVAELFPVVCEAYARLAARHDVVVLEGAGSPAEINLKARDIVNLRMAEAADAACLLVGDIDRGGVFASLLGTLELLEAHERQRIRGFVINKFRGDIALLLPGVRMIEERLRIPCVGVVPHLPDINLDEEDSVALEDKAAATEIWRETIDAPNRPLRIGVVQLPHLSNFTDFDALAAEPSVRLAYLQRADEVERADLIILPGTKQTLDDLRWLRAHDFETALHRHAARGPLLGICGGMQILGLEVRDPAGVEGGGRADGLALLPIRTVLAPEKVTRRARAQLRTSELFGHPAQHGAARGYEIHMGATDYETGAAPLFDLMREEDDEQQQQQQQFIADGATSADGRVLGTYLHGLFDDDAFRHALLHAARAACYLAPPSALAFVAANREQRINRLAAHVRRHVNLPLIGEWLNLTIAASREVR